MREAFAKNAARAGHLTESERRRMLGSVDEILLQPPTRPQAAVRRELDQIRCARRQGGRRHPAERSTSTRPR